MSTYTYSLSSDFGGTIREKQLHAEIIAESGITKTLSGVNTFEDVVDILFESALSAGEETTLNTLVSNHVPDNSKPRINFYSESPIQTSVNNTSYKKLGSFRYGGSNYIGSIDYIDVVSYKDSNVTSYDVRIYDTSNNTIIAEQTGLTNTDPDIVSLGIVSNIPTQTALLEIQARRTGGSGNSKNVYVEQVIVYHDN